MSLVDRTRAFSLSVANLFEALPRRRVAYVLGDQFLRAGLSTGAHFRESLRARSHAEYVAKLNAGLMELEEALYWLELLVETGYVSSMSAQPISTEIDQLIAIFASQIKKWKTK
jgi:four helix bundle protein